MSEQERLRERLAKLRVLTESPRGVNMDYLRNYATKKKQRSKQYYKIRAEAHAPRKHHLVEELALTSSFLSKCRNVLVDWEIKLLERYDMAPDAEILAWIKTEWAEEWTPIQLKREMLRIKKKLGAINEVVGKKIVPKRIEEPKMITISNMLHEAIEGVKKKLGIKF